MVSRDSAAAAPVTSAGAAVVVDALAIAHAERERAALARGLAIVGASFTLEPLATLLLAFVDVHNADLVSFGASLAARVLLLAGCAFLAGAPAAELAPQAVNDDVVRLRRRRLRMAGVMSLASALVLFVQPIVTGGAVADLEVSSPQIVFRIGAGVLGFVSFVVVAGALGRLVNKRSAAIGNAYVVATLLAILALLAASVTGAFALVTSATGTPPTSIAALVYAPTLVIVAACAWLLVQLRREAR